MAIVDDLKGTILPLDYFRKIAGIEPYHFWGMRNGTQIPTIECGECWSHYRYTVNQGPGRWDILDAILAAEQAYVDKLDYWPGPTYSEDEFVRIQKPKQQVIYNRTPWKLFTKYKHIRSVGTQTYTELDIGKDISGEYDATDDVTFTVTVAAGTPACEVVVCYPDSDQVEIRPIEVSITGTTATITIKKWLLGLPSLWEEEECADASKPATNCLQTLDVYRKWIDPSDQILVAWEPEMQYCGCLQESCQACQNATQTACALRGDYRHGVVGWQLATWDAVDEEYDRASVSGILGSRWPDHAYISYRHGYDSGDDCYIDRRWARDVTVLATANLDSSPCDCSDVVNWFRYWREDLGKTTDERTYAMGSTDMENPLAGTRRGHKHAWGVIRRRIGER